jgi:leucyl aminopeptidase
MLNIRIETKQDGKSYLDKKDNLGDFFKLNNEVSNNNTVKISVFRDLKSLINPMDKNLKEKILEQIELTNFSFKKNTYMIFDNNNMIVGSKGIKTKEDWRMLGFNLINYVRKTFGKCSNIIFEREVDINSKQFFEGLFLADYSFTKYKTKHTPIRDIDFYIFPKKIDKNKIEKEEHLKIKKSFENMLKITKQKIASQNLIRDIVNTTPEDSNSETIYESIVKRFKDKNNLTVTEYNEEKLKELHMNGHLAVNKSSKFPAKVVKITYEPKNFSKETGKIVLGVGKGLTYDTGGLSLKPAAHMTTMKADKSGAITLFGLADILSHSNSQNKVVLYLAFAENMINEDSYRPDDVVIHKNGVTSHIKNTDAEGRVVIFDSLVLAQEENPDFDEIFSIATLTGAAVSQFGNEAAGMVSQNTKLMEKYISTGIIEDEIFCEAKLHKFMMDGIDDDLADISNTGTPNQGCQKAGLYLTKAIKKKNIKKYIHLDIAGPAFVDKHFGTNPKGATGFALRTLFEILK